MPLDIMNSTFKSNKDFYKNLLFSTADLILPMSSSIVMVPSSPPNLDLIVTVWVLTSLGPMTAIRGTFCFSAFLMSLGRRSPWQIWARMPVELSLETISVQYCTWNNVVRGWVKTSFRNGLCKQSNIYIQTYLGAYHKFMNRSWKTVQELWTFELRQFRLSNISIHTETKLGPGSSLSGQGQ